MTAGDPTFVPGPDGAATTPAAGTGSPQRDPSSTSPSPELVPQRWTILGIIGLAQLMVVLDTTVVNIALPSAQRDLGFSTGNRQWVVTAYSLAFGSLLLMGGRLSDLLGRRLTLIVGLVGFAGASALGGAANSFALLVSARALQGVFAAVLAPAALSTLNITFTDGKERARALGVYAAIAAGGAVIGLMVGGLLTQWLSWRWCLYINLVFALPAAAGVLSYVRAREERHERVQLDIPGVLAGSGGLFSLVYGLSNAEQNGWRTTLTVTMLIASVVLLTGFVVIETRVQAPLLPIRVIFDRLRGPSYVAIALTFLSNFGVFLFLTYYFQTSLGYGPFKTGLAFLPITVGIASSAGLANTQLLPRLGPRPLIPTGMLIASGAMLWLSRLSVSSSYVGNLLGPLLILGAGVGLVFAPSINTATAGIRPEDAGVGSAMVNTSQQVGGAVGAALLSTIFSSAVMNYISSHRPPTPAVQSAAAIHGYAAAFAVSAAIFAGGALLTAVLLPSGRLAHSENAVGAL